MQFSKLFANNNIISNLRNGIDNNKFPHAILLSEKEGFGAFNIAIATVQYLFCKSHNNGDSCGVCPTCKKIENLIHPDIHFIFPINISTKLKKEKRPGIEEFYPLFREIAIKNPYFTEHELYTELGIENKSGSIGVAEAGEIIKTLSLTTYEGGAKVIIILFPERMNAESSNKLLKSIEEPGDNTYFILISQNSLKIIPTILSRCRIIEIPPIDTNTLANEIVKLKGIGEKEAQFIARYSGGSYGNAINISQTLENNNDNFDIFISILNSAISKDLVKLIELSEQLAGFGRETQKKFCIDALEIIRKLYIFSLGIEEISYIPDDKIIIYKNISQKIKKNFYKGCYSLLNSSIESIDRNVNPKFIFCDLCNKLYYNI